MATMYIHKSGLNITIADTITGNTGLGGGHQFIGYSMKDAERKYRQMHNLQGKRFEHKKVGKHFFYVF